MELQELAERKLVEIRERLAALEAKRDILLEMQAALEREEAALGVEGK